MPTASFRLRYSDERNSASWNALVMPLNDHLSNSVVQPRRTIGMFCSANRAIASNGRTKKSPQAITTTIGTNRPRPRAGRTPVAGAGPPGASTSTMAAETRWIYDCHRSALLRSIQYRPIETDMMMIIQAASEKPSWS